MNEKIQKFIISFLFGFINLIFLIYITVILSYYVTIFPSEFIYSDFLLYFMGGAVLFFFTNLIFPVTSGFFLTFEHEMVHLLTALFTFHSILSFKVDYRKGGMVKIKGQNLFIALSPYYFPLSVVILILLRELSHFQNHPIWALLFGFAEGLFLIRLLRDTHPHQLDFQYRGIIGSIFHIFVMNLFVQSILFFYFSNQIVIIPQVLNSVHSKIWFFLLNLVG